jgi:hypothetical protein
MALTSTDAAPVNHQSAFVVVAHGEIKLDAGNGEEL